MKDNVLLDKFSDQAVLVSTLGVTVPDFVWFSIAGVGARSLGAFGKSLVPNFTYTGSLHDKSIH